MRDERRRADGSRTRPDAFAQRARSAARSGVRVPARAGSRSGRRGAPRGSLANGAATRPGARSRWAVWPTARARSDRAAAISLFELGSGLARGSCGGSGSGSVDSLQSRAEPIAIAACPSAIAWWMRQMTALVPSSRGSTTSIAHSGRSRGSRSAISPATISRSSASPTGLATGTLRTCRRTSKFGSSAHTGASRLWGVITIRRRQLGASAMRRAIRSRRYVTPSPVRSAITTLHVCPTIDLDSSARMRESSGESLSVIVLVLSRLRTGAGRPRAGAVSRRPIS